MHLQARFKFPKKTPNQFLLWTQPMNLMTFLIIWDYDKLQGPLHSSLLFNHSLLWLPKPHLNMPTWMGPMCIWRATGKQWLLRGRINSFQRWIPYLFIQNQVVNSKSTCIWAASNFHLYVFIICVPIIIKEKESMNIRGCGWSRGEYPGRRWGWCKYITYMKLKIPTPK